MPPAQQIIHQMLEANRRVSYEGVFVYRHHNEMDTMRIIHKVDGNNIQERIISLTGPPREVIRKKDMVTCILPDNESVMVEKRRPETLKINQLPEKILKASAYYTFSIAGQGRVADRPAWIIDILPKDEYRYGYQLWVDLETKLLLKSELRNKKGSPLEQFFFANLQIKKTIPDELLEPDMSGVSYNWYDNSADNLVADSVSWKAAWAPDGFVMQDHEKIASNQQNTSVTHLVYSDGLAVISIFIEKLKGTQKVVTGASKLGGINTFITVIDGYIVTAISEAPKDTVKLFAESVTTVN